MYPYRLIVPSRFKAENVLDKARAKHNQEIETQSSEVDRLRRERDEADANIKSRNAKIRESEDNIKVMERELEKKREMMNNLSRLESDHAANKAKLEELNSSFDATAIQVRAFFEFSLPLIFFTIDPICLRRYALYSSFLYVVLSLHQILLGPYFTLLA